jgi:peptidoglycan/xylan/chitin deacetylase (PgdA/CDA1 family)
VTITGIDRLGDDRETVPVSRTAQLARLICTGNFDRIARLSWRGLLIFNYHRIGVPGEFDDPDLFSCTQEELDVQVGLLADRFEIVEAGTSSLTGRGRRIAFTVDDGYRDQLLAAEVFAAHRVPGSFFVCTGFVDEPHHAWWDEIAWLTAGLRTDLPPSEWLPDGLLGDGLSPAEQRRTVVTAYKQRAGLRGPEFLEWLATVTGKPRLSAEETADRWMSWDEVRSLRTSGMEVGGHTVTHPILATLAPDVQRAEIEGSVHRLRAELSEPVDTFAYPVGASDSFDATTMALLTELGVRRAYSFCGGLNRAGRTEPFDVRRVGVFGESAEIIRATAALPAVFGSPRRYA